MRRFFHVMAIVAAGALGTIFSVAGHAQEKAAAPVKKIAVRAGHLIDGRSDKVIDSALILIEGDTITSVASGVQPPAGVEVLDLSRYTVMPGFMDTHTHVVLNGDITAEDYDVQLLKQSIPYRAILGARNARIALEHGFTTIRDLETEGAMYADVDVKTAIANGEVPGPRMQVATRAMTPTGMYPLLGSEGAHWRAIRRRRRWCPQSCPRAGDVWRRLDQILFGSQISF
jgi:imidazolonepropionase-like amidohydrolase